MKKGCIKKPDEVLVELTTKALMEVHRIKPEDFKRKCLGVNCHNSKTDLLKVRCFRAKQDFSYILCELLGQPARALEFLGYKTPHHRQTFRYNAREIIGHDDARRETLVRLAAEIRGKKSLHLPTEQNTTSISDFLAQDKMQEIRKIVELIKKATDLNLKEMLYSAIGTNCGVPVKEIAKALGVPKKQVESEAMLVSELAYENEGLMAFLLLAGKCLKRD